MSNNGTSYTKQYQMLRPSVNKELAHGIVVSNLAYLLGRELHFTDTECYHLAIAGLLHDIGKLELALYVKGREDETLVIEELRYIRRHTVLGAKILQEKGYSQDIVDMIKFHHENCDGSGYPMNLTRNDIPAGARILRICDVFAALTADRSYRKAFDQETAMQLMIEEAKYYDVQYFMAFMNLAHKIDLKSIIDTTEFEYKLEAQNGYIHEVFSTH